ncbi:MAG: glutamate--tRNA ligase [Thermotogae bacterium]|nr:glutamate--tRNA ligase [Thermotogota bacterium]
MGNIRVRFAPSPTGYLHVGGIRTALFNWLFSKSRGGKFILRIEDTDIHRSTREFEAMMISALKWCKIEWDEGPDIGGEFGPYRQSERVKKGIYEKFTDRLIGEKKAYYSIYAQDNPQKELFRTYKKEEASSRLHVIKFAVPQGSTVVKDLAKGDVRFDNHEIKDFIIVKSNGYPTYNLAVVIDDATMKITHVIRGEDHLSNTPKQILLYEALNLTSPAFMHIPLILGPDRTPLSKRHGGTSVQYFKSEGILPDALINHLALLGWEAPKEIFHIKDIISSFNPNRISNKGVIFDYDKLRWINEKHMRTMDIDELFDYFKRWIVEEKIPFSDAVRSDEEYAKEVLDIARQKVSTLKELVVFIPYFFDENYEFTQEFRNKYITKEFARTYLELARKRFKTLDTWDMMRIKDEVEKICRAPDISKKQFIQTLRGALTGRLITPGLYETMSAMGKKRVLRRINRCLEEI